MGKNGYTYKYHIDPYRLSWFLIRPKYVDNSLLLERCLIFRGRDRVFLYTSIIIGVNLMSLILTVVAIPTYLQHTTQFYSTLRHIGYGEPTFVQDYPSINLWGKLDKHLFDGKTTNNLIATHIHIHTHIYIYIISCVCI